MLALDCSEAVLASGAKLRNEGLDVDAAITDVTDRARLVATLAPYPHLDVVVAAAGIAKVAPFEEITDDDFNQVMKVNLYGVFVTLQECVRRMGQGGRVIAISSWLCCDLNSVITNC